MTQSVFYIPSKRVGKRGEGNGGAYPDEALDDIAAKCAPVGKRDATELCIMWVDPEKTTIPPNHYGGA